MFLSHSLKKRESSKKMCTCKLNKNFHSKISSSTKHIIKYIKYALEARPCVGHCVLSEPSALIQES